MLFCMDLRHNLSVLTSEYGEIMVIAHKLHSVGFLAHQICILFIDGHSRNTDVGLDLYFDRLWICSRIRPMAMGCYKVPKEKRQEPPPPEMVLRWT